MHIAVIGGGSAAFAAAIRAAEAGARVTLIEGGEIGGTCVNVGCIPSKMLLRAARTRYDAGHHAFRGIARHDDPVDRGTLLSQIRAHVDALRSKKYTDILQRNPAIGMVQGHAVFRAPDALDVRLPDGGTMTVNADRVLVATGSHPALPAIPGLAGTPFWTSTEALFADETPSRLVIIGASFVAVELAQAFRRLGSEVWILARHRLLGRADSALGTGLEAALEGEGVHIVRDAADIHVGHAHGGFFIDTADGRLEADRLLVATGRTPATAGLGLDAVDVGTDAVGAIRVDDRLQTTNPAIFAAGDCTDLPGLVYVGAAAGSRAATNMTGGQARLDLSVLPRVIFTDPQVAWVGLNEAEALNAGMDVESRRIELDDVPRALVNLDTRGFVQLTAERGTGRLLGAQILAPDAGEIIQTAALAIRAGMSVDGIAAELFPYLTMAEGLKLCAQAFSRDIAQLSCCAG